MEENLINNTLRIEQTIRLTRTVIELMLSKDVETEAEKNYLLNLNQQNLN